MSSAALIPAAALIAGAASAIQFNVDAPRWAAAVACALALASWRRGWPRLSVALCAAGFAAAGITLGWAASDSALHTPLRRELDQIASGFAIESLGQESDLDPVLTRAVLVEDAAVAPDVVSLRVRVVAVAVHAGWRLASGGVLLTVGGRAAAERATEWRAGRTIEAPVAFRRPTRFLDDGVPDMERDLALEGTTLFGSIKSGLLVDVTAGGGIIGETAARIRRHVRSAIGRHVAPHGAVGAAIVTAVLIGDRTGLPDDVRDRLQAAGTYHVIAISGGNIAIVAGLVIGVLWIAGLRGRLAAAATIAGLLAYAQVVTAGPSVWRATLMAVVYLSARLFDHRTPPWQAGAMAAALMVVAQPLEVRDPGFLLTFGATVALLEGAARGASLRPARRLAAWLVASLLSSAAVEVALLPVSATFFSRVTGAGLVLNLIAVPLMAIGQVAGMIVVMLDGVEMLADAAGWLAHGAASLLLGSARLVEIAPWLAARVPPPPALVVCTYYLALGAVLLCRGRTRLVAGAAYAVSLLLIVSGVDPVRAWPAPLDPQRLRVTMFDVGQSEAVLLESGGQAWLIDSGGRPFGTGSFDVGTRVLAPALWALGHRTLDALVITHGDPDHMGGATGVLGSVPPHLVEHGIEVPAHLPMRELLGLAVRLGIDVRPLRAGMTVALGAVRVRVLNPPMPDWERPRVRNDDSIVLELVHGDVALLMTGDIGAAVERVLAPQLTPARVRILKVAHHGSRTSSSASLLESWRPQYALISAGRGNTFGHPHPDVLQRLASVGAQVFRTDRDGQITIESDGHDVTVRTFTHAHRSSVGAGFSPPGDQLYVGPASAGPINEENPFATPWRPAEAGPTTIRDGLSLAATPFPSRPARSPSTIVLAP